jgi:hypothetical protein
MPAADQDDAWNDQVGFLVVGSGCGRDDVRRYLDAVVGDRVPAASIDAFIDNGPRAMEFLEDASPHLRLQWSTGYSERAAWSTTAGQVLRADGTVIAGLYATGNTSAAVMRNDYAGAGATIGSAMVFGFVRARHAAKHLMGQ